MRSGCDLRAGRNAHLKRNLADVWLGKGPLNQWLIDAGEATLA